MTDWLGTSFNYKYDGAGNACAMSTGGVPSTCTNVPTGGVTESSTFDQQGGLAATTTATGTMPLYALTYTRDNNGNLASSQATVGTTAQTAASYTYDQQTQVASGPVSTGATGSTSAYTADHGITAASGFRTASYSPSDQLCLNYSSSSSNACGSTPTGGTGFTYDASGDRLTQFTQGTGSTTTTQSLGWAQESERLCWTLAGASSNSCGSAPSGATSYSYDAFGLRTSATTGSTTTTFTWDPSAQDLLSDSTHYFVYGLSSTVPTEEIATSGSPVVSDMLFTDQIGNVRGIVRLTGPTLTNTVTNATSYDTYGNPMVAPGGANEAGGLSIAQTGLNSNYIDSSPFGFGDGYTDTSGFVYLVHRYYEPASGQFVSVDPLISASDLGYAFASNNPIGLSDPSGLHQCVWYEPWTYAGCALNAADAAWQAIEGSVASAAAPTIRTFIRNESTTKYKSGQKKYPPNQAVSELGHTFRTPDYVSIQVTASAIVQGGAILSFTRWGSVFLSPLLGISSPGVVGLVSAGWLDQMSAPSKETVNKFLDEDSIGGGFAIFPIFGIAGGGIQEIWGQPGHGGGKSFATEIGVGGGTGGTLGGYGSYGFHVSDSGPTWTAKW